MMRKWMSIFLALAILAACSFGCTGIQNDAKVKCPKCGEIFTINEDLDVD